MLNVLKAFNNEYLTNATNRNPFDNIQNDQRMCFGTQGIGIAR